MKAIVCRSYGAPDDLLHRVEIDEPETAEDQVLAQVHAASVNPPTGTSSEAPRTSPG